MLPYECSTLEQFHARDLGQNRRALKKPAKFLHGPGNKPHTP